MMDPRFQALSWEGWQPRIRATLLFVIRDGQVLLMEKKRGLGAGKVNGPGGKIDPGEDALSAAIREVEEELCVTPTGVVERGELFFQFTDGLSIHVTVFAASGCLGKATETDEAVPLWTPLDRIPYDRMWADDRIWLPEMLAGHRFRLRALFEDDTLLGHDIKLEYGAG